MGCRENGNMVQCGMHLTGERVRFANPVDFVPEKLHPYQHILALCRENLQYVPMHPEAAAL